MNFNDLKKKLKADISGLKKINIALLGDSPTQLLHIALKGWGVERGYNFNIYEADYDQINMQITDASSTLYVSQPDYIIIFHSAQKLQSKFYSGPKSEKIDFSSNHIAYLNNLMECIQSNLSKTKIIYCNLPLLDSGVYGNYSNKTNLSFTYHLRKINTMLMDLSMQVKNLFIADIEQLNSFYGKSVTVSPAIYIQSGFVFSIDFLPTVAKCFTDIILSIEGNFKKCLILDLDNTTWGGVIGDDGIENIEVGDLGIGKAFTELQLWAKQLKERGIILCVCSKNTYEVAIEPFEKHPDMVLKLEDIAVFVANWENKADNIRHIQNVLNIGFDSMVFLDDNPFERNLVRGELPQVTVPELPSDPAEYLSYLHQLNLFETATISEEDSNRTQQYQEESRRVSLKKAFLNEAEYLQSLDMKAELVSFDKFNAPRVAQLSQRSNQFNLRTVRYTEGEIFNMSSDQLYDTMAISLKDKYGSYGLIAVIILTKAVEHLFIDTWFMSCRVLKRGVEKYTLNKIVEVAKRNNIKEIRGEYIPTSKNGLVENHYSELGFKKVNASNLWLLNVTEFTPFGIFISDNENNEKNNFKKKEYEHK